MGEAASVSVVVLNHNGRGWLPRCLAALERQQDVAVEAILVDNGSTDDSVAFVRREFPSVRIISLDRNTGFAAGNNAGVRAARERYVALLNNDTEPSPRWLRALIDALQTNRWASLAASRIVYMHDPARIDSAGDGLTRWGGAFKHLHGRLASGADAPREVFGVCGAACLVRRDVFDEVGGFDEDFFAVYEDVDFSYRAQLLGHRCIYAPDALVLHAGSATLGRLSDQAIFLGQRNLEWTYFKNTPALLLLATLPGHLVYDLAAAAYCAATGRLGAFVRGKLSALRHPVRVARKRRDIQRRRRATLRHLWRMMDRRWVALKWREKRYDLQAARSR